MMAIGAPVHADTATANRLETEARELAAAGKLTEAAARYREAYAADPRPELMCNVGVAYHKATDWPRAHRYLEQCLAMGASLDAAFVSRARTVLGAIVKKLEAGDFTPIDLVVSPPSASVAIEGFDDPIVGARRVYVPFGTYRVVVHAEGHVDHVATLAASRREATKLAVALQRAPQAEPRPQEPPPPPRPEPIPPQRPAPAVPERASRVPAYVATATTLVLGGAGVALYLKARDEVDAAEAAIERPDFEDHRDAAKRYQRLSWAAGGLAGVAAIASGYLWYRATRSSTRVEATPTAGGATLSIAGRF